MAGRRHDRIPSNEPASIEAGAETYDGTVTDFSESGAAIDFSLPTGESRVRFDLGSAVNVDSKSVHEKEARVVRHYDGGFALNFDGFKKEPGE